MNSQNKKFIIAGSIIALSVSLAGVGVYLNKKADKRFNNTTTTTIINTTTSQPTNSTSTSTTTVASPNISIESPKQGETLQVGAYINIKSNNTADKVSVTVISDKWGEIYSSTVDSSDDINLNFSPNTNLTTGDSGRIIVKLIKGETTLKEESIWVNF